MHTIFLNHFLITILFILCFKYNTYVIDSLFQKQGIAKGSLNLLHEVELNYFYIEATLLFVFFQILTQNATIYRASPHQTIAIYFKLLFFMMF
jgi:hypothetical protein